jgi:hypothetical protein
VRTQRTWVTRSVAGLIRTPSMQTWPLSTSIILTKAFQHCALLPKETAGRGSERVPASVAGTDRRSYVSVVRDRHHKSVDAYYILRNALQLSMQFFPDPAGRIGILVLINSRGQHLVRESLVALV